MNGLKIQSTGRDYQVFKKKKRDRSLYFPCEQTLNSKIKNRMKLKGWKRIYCVNSSHKSWGGYSNIRQHKLVPALIIHSPLVTAMIGNHWIADTRDILKAGGRTQKNLVIFIYVCLHISKISNHLRKMSCTQ